MLTPATLRSIHFRYITPSTTLPKIVRFVLERFWIFPQQCFDRFNTRIPFLDASRRALLAHTAGMKKMSTLAIGAIINECVREMPDDACYLNIGTWHGFSLFSGMVGNPQKRCIGVDNFSQFDRPKQRLLKRFDALKSARHTFVEADWKTYLKEQHTGSIGVYFYDAGHDAVSQREALEEAEKFFIVGTIILVDDMNWGGPQQGTEEFLRSRKGYEVILDCRTACNCHPTFWNGILVLRKCS